jgi:hypothetical protein
MAPPSSSTRRSAYDCPRVPTVASKEGAVAWDDDGFLNSYHNAATPPGPDVPAELRDFMLAADPVLGQAAELARVLARAHQGAATQLIGEGWAHARKYFSLSQKYAAWADYHTPARGFGLQRLRVHGPTADPAHRPGATGATAMAELRRRGGPPSPRCGGGSPSP